MKNKIGVDKIYVVNLKRHEERRKALIEFLDTLDTPYEIIEAIDGMDIRPTKNFLEKTLSKYFYDPGGFVTRGVVGCALSHKLAWDKFLSDGLETALILEDDVRATDDFHEWIENGKLDKSTKDLETLNWGVCFFGKVNPDIETTHDFTDEIGIYKKFNNNTWCAHSYLIKKHSAQWLSENLLPLNCAVDVYLECSPFRVLTLKKSMFVQKHMLYKPPYQDDVPVEYQPSTLLPYQHIPKYDENSFNISDEEFHGIVLDALLPVVGIDSIKLKIDGIELPILKVYLNI